MSVSKTEDGGSNPSIPAIARVAEWLGAGPQHQRQRFNSVHELKVMPAQNFVLEQQVMFLKRGRTVCGNIYRGDESWKCTNRSAI